MSEVIEVNDLAGIREVIDNNPKVLLEFGAVWCNPCRLFYPHFVKFAQQHPEIVCVKADIDVDPEVVNEFKIQSVPQVMYFVDGVFVKQVTARTVVQLNAELD